MSVVRIDTHNRGAPVVKVVDSISHYILKHKHLVTNCDRIVKNKKRDAVVCISLFYLFENWGARRAFFKPYFFLSFTRGSRVKKPSFFNAGRQPSSA